MEMMDQAATTPPLPVLPRLDRLDRMLQLLEEKHNLGGGGVKTKVGQQYEQEDAGRCLPLSSALEQVHDKGSLMERLDMLENRLLKLMTFNINIEGNTSYDNSTTSSTNLMIPLSDENMAPSHDSSSSLTSLDDDDKMIITSQGHHTTAQGEASTEETGQRIKKKKKKNETNKSSYPKKWFACLPAGC